MTKYDDDYPSCSRTYASLALSHTSKSPDEVSQYFATEPDFVGRKGEVWSKYRPPRQLNVWRITTRNLEESKDYRKHLDLILTFVEKHIKSIDALRSQGWEIYIPCFWESSAGNGGPYLDVATMKRLVKYDLELHFDIWFDFSEEGDA